MPDAAFTFWEALGLVIGGAAAGQFGQIVAAIAQGRADKRRLEAERLERETTERNQRTDELRTMYVDFFRAFDRLTSQRIGGKSLELPMEEMMLALERLQLFAPGKIGDWARAVSTSYFQGVRKILPGENLKDQDRELVSRGLDELRDAIRRDLGLDARAANAHAPPAPGNGDDETA